MVALGVAVGLVVAVPVARAEDAVACDTTPTEGWQAHHPYLPDAAVSTAAANPLYRYGENPYVFTLFVPDDLPDGPVPLLVVHHGLGHAARNFEDRGLEELAAREGLIVALPSGARSWWATEDSFDVKFVRDVVATVRAERCIDARRIFAFGASNGGFMTYRLACDAADLFAAAAVWAGTPADNTYPFGGPCAANQDAAPGFETMPIAIWHGTEDATVDYAVGRGALRGWVDRYRCDTAPLAVTTDEFGSTEHYGGCRRPDTVARAAATGVPFELRFRTVDGHPHSYPAPPGPGVPTADDIVREVYAFLAGNPRAAAAGQDAPSLADMPVRDPERHGAWLTALPDHGPDVELVPSVDALASGVVHVELAVTPDPATYPPSMHDDHPRCPSTAPGSGKIRIVGREVTLLVTDELGTTAHVAATALDPTTGLAVASFTFPPPAEGPVVVEATIEGDRIASHLLCTIRAARYQQTVTLSP